MNEVSLYQTTVIISMFVVNMLVVSVMWLNMRAKDKTVPFNPKYLIYAIFGTILGYNWFVPQMTYSGTLIETFMSSAAFALSGQYLVEKGAKAAKSRIESINKKFGE